MSLRTVAKLMDVDPSTLSRSISQQALSADMAERTQALLKAGIPSIYPAGTSVGEARAAPSPENSLLILHKFVESMPEVESALKAVLANPTTAFRRNA